MIKKVVIALLHIIVSTAFSGVFYVGWMAMAIPALKSEYGILIKGLVWILAPVITSLGFWVGIFIVDLLSFSQKPKFWEVYRFPLIGCSVGAAIVVPFGPMLIVFGMFGLGGLSIIIREIKYVREQA